MSTKYYKSEKLCGVCDSTDRYLSDKSCVACRSQKSIDKYRLRIGSRTKINNSKLKQLAQHLGEKIFVSVTQCKKFECKSFVRYVSNSDCVKCAKKRSKNQKKKLRSDIKALDAFSEMHKNINPSQLYSMMRYYVDTVENATREDWRQSLSNNFAHVKDIIDDLVSGKYDDELSGKYDEYRIDEFYNNLIQLHKMASYNMSKNKHNQLFIAEFRVCELRLKNYCKDSREYKWNNIEESNECFDLTLALMKYQENNHR